MPPSVLVVAFGNDLMGDDGAGPAVLRRLRASGAVEGLRIEDGGSDALQLVELWHGEHEIWLVDAVSSGGVPGTIHERAHDEVLAIPQLHATAHRLSLPESLRWLGLAHPEMAGVRYRFWGIEVGSVALGVGLDARVDAACTLLADVLRRAGAASHDVGA